MNVKVLDENDHEPGFIFEPDQLVNNMYLATISSSARTGTTVVQVKVREPASILLKIKVSVHSFFFHFKN